MDADADMFVQLDLPGGGTVVSFQGTDAFFYLYDVTGRYILTAPADPEATQAATGAVGALAGWLDTAPARPSMAALIGPSGPARAAAIARFTAACLARGWQLGQVARRQDKTNTPIGYEPTPGRPLCLLAEADRWSRRQVLELPRLVDAPGVPARILVAIGEPQWHDLAYQLAKSGIHRGPAVRTGPGADPP
ncbi:hypothetical protein Cs7R123_49080 [Catellatospora sp. TT07R-123]|uniref:hypothetical protein n=1 Tax=Catellatospora sp. TT07R-123 TaxID=2733863 RepID=UPI001B1E2005|nr:hypothetical protein [Catellatospora sp. TT07R-123]GHJ47566.1 hypothetical protein Cs7R123_49080 [Catellatospora sp. TT07R-123]